MLIMPLYCCYAYSVWYISQMYYGLLRGTPQRMAEKITAVHIA
jgi:hypothetical protein